MITPSQAGQNRLLDALPADLRRNLQSGSCVAMHSGETLCEAGDDYSDVYFPLDGCISMVVQVDQHPALELGVIGHEGMLGATDVLGPMTSPWRAVVRGSGSAVRLSRRQFRTLQRRSPGWQGQLRRYVHLVLVQQSRMNACAHYHRLEERLSRWLLMALDRTAGNKLHFRHRFIADMLGVQRSAVTIAAGDLQREGLIRYVRGEIYVLDRAGLRAHACSCYQTLLDDDAEAFPPAEWQALPVASSCN